MAPLALTASRSVGSSMLACSCDHRAVERRRRRRLEALQLVPLEPRLVLLQAVLGEHRAVRVDDDHALRAVDDQQLVLADQRARVVQRDDGGNRERARHDRRVRGGAADVRHERREGVLAEEDHVGRRQVAGDEDHVRVLARRASRQAPLEPASAAEHALGHLAHVGLALAQVLVLDVVELRRQLVELHAQRPFGVAALLGDDLARRLREGGVLEHHEVHVHEGRQLGGRAVAHAVGQLLQLVAHLLDRVVEAALLAADESCGGDLVVIHLGGHAGEQVRVADGDAAGHADAVHREADASRGAGALGGHGGPGPTRPRRTCRR